MAASGNRKIKIACPGCGQKLDVTDLPPFSRVACPSCGLSLIVPKWFNNYLLEEPEGKGGMATVYRALDVALDREVAIKIFRPDLAELHRTDVSFRIASQFEPLETFWLE